MSSFSPEHRAYQEELKCKLIDTYIRLGQSLVLLTNKDLIGKLWLLDLSGISQFVRTSYAKGNNGRPPRDPVSMFRSLILMTFLRVTGYNEWVRQLRTVPLYAILSGFEPDDVPGASTFYDFMDRLWESEKRATRADRRRKLRQRRKRSKHKPKRGEKQPPKNAGTTERIMFRLLRDQNRPHRKADAVMQGIFQDLFVKRSGELGLLGSDPTQLAVAGDGTVFRSASSPFGHKACDCRKRGIFKCDHPRRLSDPDASWGWDSHRGIYVYGNSAYVLTAADSPHDLPVYLAMNACQRHDSIASLYALDGFRRANPEFRISQFLGDSAHDAYAIYEYHDHYNIESLIDLNPRNAGQRRYPGPLNITSNGVPICGCGLPMVNWGYCPGRRRIKWRCPIAVGQRPDGAPEVCTASPSPYGRTIYTKPKDDLRLFTRTPRGSDEWKVKFAKRSGAERTIASIKDSYGLEKARHRTRHIWHTRLFLAAMAQHVDAWYRTSQLDMHSIIMSWTDEVLVAA